MNELKIVYRYPKDWKKIKRTNKKDDRENWEKNNILTKHIIDSETGIKNGAYVLYSNTFQNTPILKGNYLQGLRHGKFITYSENTGEVINEMVYKNGIKFK